MATPIKIPQVLNGRDTRGNSDQRPRKPEVGHPFFDTDLGVLLVATGKPEPLDWELVNAEYFEAQMEATARQREIVVRNALAEACTDEEIEEPSVLEGDDDSTIAFLPGDEDDDELIGEGG